MIIKEQVARWIVESDIECWHNTWDADDYRRLTRFAELAFDAGAKSAEKREPLTEEWEELFKIMSDETPYFYRRSMDKSCYEVGIRNNTDWRDVISEDQTILSHHASHEIAEHEYAVLDFKYCWNRAHGIGVKK